MSYRLANIVAELPSTVPFVGPEAQERASGRKFRARLGANESVFGPSPRAIQAMSEAAAQAWMYGDPENHDLRQALARHHGVDAGNIIIGEGIDGLFGYVARLLVEPGSTIATSRGAYPTFNYQVAGCGGQIATVDYREDREDPEALLALARQHDARMIYLANPDNPMGSWWDAGTISDMITAVPDGTLLCLDEAYADFAPREAIPPLDVHDARVLRFRTFSKAYGLAGCRLGYAIGTTDLIKCFDKIRNHFGVNRIAQAGALAALQDQQYLRDVVAKVAAARQRIAAIAAASGLEALPSATNFVAIDCGGDGELARRVLQELVGRGVFVRMPGVAPLDRCIRISAGTDADLDVLEEVLPEAVAAARAGGEP